uniref:Uncharacterized protein n=1 Tax=Anguilla anguilla TaxID=7936 RepID=A0A0E9RSU9_ANGAN
MITYNRLRAGVTSHYGPIVVIVFTET